MHNNSSSPRLKAKKIENKDFKPWDQPNGEYCLSGKGIMVHLPCGHFFNDFEGKWKYQDIEDENKITLSPSIFCSPSVPCWHGYLENGEFRTV